MARGLLILTAILAAAALAEPRRVLLLTHSAGFRHDSIPVAVESLKSLAPDQIEVVHAEGAGAINTETLAGFDAVFFFTSGELPFSDEQKLALLHFVRSGKGFGGAHSATDTLYGWPEYGELIGGRFNGHPWTQGVRIAVEEPEDPLVNHLAPDFEIFDEIYTFREFSRERSRVLLKLDGASLGAEGDHPLAWVHSFGEGRVFYTALGHFDDVWRDERFRQMLRQSLRWLTRELDSPTDRRTETTSGRAAADDGRIPASPLAPRRSR